MIPETPRRSRRLLRAAVILAALVLLGVFVGIPAAVSSGPVRRAILAEASRVLGRPVDVEGIRLGLGFSATLSLRGARLANPEGFASPQLGTVKRIEADLPWSSLWGEHLRVTRLRCAGAELTLERHADGRTNLDGLALLPGPSRSGLLASAGPASVRSLEVERIRLEDAVIHVRDASGFEADLSGIALDARVTALPLAGAPSDLLQKAVMDGSLRVASARTAGLEAVGTSCAFTLGGGVARLASGEAAVNGGSVRFSASADFQDWARPAFALQAEAADVRLTGELAERYLDPFTVRLTRVLEGRIGKGTLELAWRGTARDEVFASLAGKGDLGFRATAVNFSALFPQFRLPAEALTFGDMAAVFTVGNGVVSNTLRLASADSGAELTGTLRLADEAIQYLLVPSGRLREVFSGRSIPVSGTLREPKVDIGQAVKQELQHLLEDKIKELLP